MSYIQNIREKIVLKSSEATVFKTINNPARNSSVDIFRGLAIITVVLYHFNERLPLGNLGVDLFFVISGLLVGGLLTRQFEEGRRINFFKFVLQRGFKIWPSYYAFLLVGTIIAYCFYHVTDPDNIIPLWDLKRYVFFYENYKGLPFHWSFDHVWSLCVEEHFYIMLPILFLVIQRFRGKKYEMKLLFTGVILTIIAGIIFKFISYYFTRSQETYAATHNRIDALAWGVLLNLIITRYKDNMKSLRFVLSAFLAGLLLFIISIYLSVNVKGILFNKIYLHSIIPVSFFLMLLGLYFVNFSQLKFLQFVAYYSYNWYLWHPVFVRFITRHLGDTLQGLIAHLLITFVIAIIMTTFIEEFFLKKRKAVIDRLFSKEIRTPSQQSAIK